MSVAGHSRIEVEEYDVRIRTFVPDYELMVGIAADSLAMLNVNAPAIVDLGVGTGSLADRCLTMRPGARLIGIDSDPAMLELARVRLLHHSSTTFLAGNFLDISLPRCNAFVACLSLHHIPSPDTKREFYRRCHAALHEGGLLVSADCFPAKESRDWADQREQWLTHLKQSYTASEAAQHLESWAEEDRYFALEDELEWLGLAGFNPEVRWRSGGFAVIVARRQALRAT